MTPATKKKLRDAVNELRDLYHRWVAADIRAYPNLSYAEIGRTYGLSESTVYTIARLHGLSRAKEQGDNDEQP